MRCVRVRDVDCMERVVHSLFTVHIFLFFFLYNKEFRREHHEVIGIGTRGWTQSAIDRNEIL